MTTYEHAMVGICGALAAGLHRRHGWQIVAWAGVAAVLPDWDGLTILLGSHCFAEGHRLWGHNLLVAGLVAAVFSAVAYQTDVASRSRKWLAKRWKFLADREGTAETPKRGVAECCLWICVGVAAAYSHLAADLIISAGTDLPTWGVPLLWPWTNETWAYPMAPWGNPGPTLIFAASMFAMLRWKTRLQTIALGSLLAVAAYLIAFRAFSW